MGKGNELRTAWYRGQQDQTLAEGTLAIICAVHPKCHWGRWEAPWRGPNDKL